MFLGWLISAGKIKIKAYKVPYQYLVFHFLIWIILYFAYTWFYGKNPGISDIEKLPDLSMLVSAYRAEKLPPLNVFASDQVINYYYFGFYQAATLAHMAAVEAWQIFNPMKALVLASACSGLASTSILVLDRMLSNSSYKAKMYLGMLGGILSFSFAYLIGNFHTMYRHVILGESNFWYPDATRYIINTIHEFPLYSFIIGDLHAHLLAFPAAGVTLTLVFLYTEKLSTLNNKLSEILKGSWQYLVPLCLLYGFSYASNSWDIFTGLLLVGFLTWFLLKEKSLFNYRTLLNTGALSLLYVFLAVILFLPFWLLFEPISSGLGHTPADKSSPFIKLMVIWLIHGCLPFLYLCLEHKKEFVFRFIRCLCALGFGLIIFMEYFYFKDIYSGHIRANTMFKIGIQVWVWFSLASSCYFIYIISNEAKFKRHVQYGLVALFAFLFGSGLIYTKKSIDQYLTVNKANKHFTDGIDFLRKNHPGDYAVIQWLKQNEKKQTNVLTSVGDSFSTAGAINAFSGHPTVLTWHTHNWLWHGSQDKEMKPLSLLQKRTGMEDSVQRRSMDVTAIYSSKSMAISRSLIDKYRIQYIVISERERVKYPQLNEAHIQALGQKVFTYKDTSLYKVSQHESE